MLPPSTGEIASTATFACGGRASIPNTALPSTFAGVSRRGVARPMSRKSLAAFSGGGGGTGKRGSGAWPARRN